MANLDELAKQHAISRNGICLIPRPGVEMPSCHENDFCACDLESAYRAGFVKAVEMASVAVSAPSLIVDDRDKYALNRAWHAISRLGDKNTSV